MDAITINKLKSFTAGLIGQSCCHKRIGEWKGLSIGFGKMLPYRGMKGVLKMRPEWDIRTNFGAWRLFHEKRMLFGKGNDKDYLTAADTGIDAIELGVLSSIDFISDLDVCVRFTSGYRIEFLAIATDDEYIDIFSPYRTCLEITVPYGVRIGLSDAPWPPEAEQWGWEATAQIGPQKKEAEESKPPPPPSANSSTPPTVPESCI